ncbi:MAG TPA: Rieske 2Fe-2S domain-containing protein [Gemmatimonadales bacterium]|nr:Rieske 2Fe-2S domain-containing protein [Gemmatimonadales bacterium]
MPDRREFLVRVTTAVAAIMAGLAASPREAAALPLTLGRALLVRGDEITYPLPAADGTTIDQDNEVILVRWKGAVYAFNLSCPHQNTALKWLASDGRFQCPKHKSKYQPDGTFMSGRATRNMDRFAVRKEAGKLVVNVARLYESDKQRALWDEAQVTV